MKIQWILLSLPGFIAGCVSTSPELPTTEIYTFYPLNEKAKKWGVFHYVDSNEKGSITGPNKERFYGELTKLPDDRTSQKHSYSRTSGAYGGGFDNWIHGGSNTNTYASDTTEANIVPWVYSGVSPSGIIMDCEGRFSRATRRSVGICKFSNGMEFRLHLESMSHTK